MPNPLETLVKEVLANLPQAAQGLKEDLRQSLQTSLEIGLKRLDLVTRDEFEAQKAVLARLREQIQHLETRLNALEDH